MANEMRDRLVELFKQKSCVYTPCDKECSGCGNIEIYDSDIESIADYLLDDGWIRLPYKVGDTVYRTSGNFGGKKIYKGVIDQIGIYDGIETRFWVHGHPLCFTCADIGKTVFLTKSEAEQKLKEMRGGNGKVC